MKELFIGEVIKRKRKELGLTQEELCEGICEPSTISRIESGKQVPAKNKLDALLQRLDLPGDRYYALLSRNELEISNLQSQIISCNVAKNKRDGLQYLEKLEEIVSEDDHLIRQFILRSKTAFGYLDGEDIRPYTFDEKEKMLFEALYLTVPKFDIEEIDKNFYTIEEIKIINQIALNYSNSGKSKKAIDVYNQLLKYIEKHFCNMEQTSGIFILISYNYSRILCLEKTPKQAIEIAENGRKACIQFGKSEWLAGLLVVLADCLHQLGCYNESKERFLESYYMYRSLDDYKNAEIVKGHAKELLNFIIN